MIEKDWITDAGLRAVAVWIDQAGFRCGYVCIPSDHPLYGVDYSQESAALGTLSDLEGEPMGKRSPMSLLAAMGKEEESLVSPDLYFNVHGGITYSGESCPMLGDTGWWFGFDCGHSGDATGYSHFEGDILRSLEYVTDECESLARQLAKLHPKEVTP